MAIAVWAATTSFSVGNVRRSSSDEGTGLFFGAQLLVHQPVQNLLGLTRPATPLRMERVSGLQSQQRMAILQSPTPVQLLSCFS